jgi:quercetin dioxygenase-like cupin family protein
MQIRSLVLSVTLMAVTATLAAQSPAPAAAYKSHADIAAGLSAARAADNAAGAAVTVAPGISVRKRSASDGAQYAIVHPFSSEVYYVIDGSATLVTGGVLEPPPAAPPTDPDIVRSAALKGGDTRTVAKGDVIVLPPGTPHWFASIDGAITYLESRVRVK